jgi:hypothetical protein
LAAPDLEWNSNPGAELCIYFVHCCVYLWSGLFGPKGEEITGELRKLHNEELHDLYFSPNILRVIKSRRMRWVRHVARMGESEACIRFWWENLRERDHWGDPGVDRKIILGWIFRKWDVGVWTGLSWLRIETGAGQL